MSVYESKFSVLINKKIKNIYKFSKEMFVEIEQKPIWQYHIIDDLEQYQYFPYKILYQDILLKYKEQYHDRVIYTIIN